MSRVARSLEAVRALWSRTPTVAVVLAAIVLLGWTLNEVVPRYGVERHRQEGPGRLDHPTFLIGDCAYYRATLVSLLEDGDLDVKNNLFVQGHYALPGNVAMGRNGAFYPKHPILLAVAALPFYVVAGDFGLLAFNLLQLCALVLVMWLGARRYAPDAVAFPLMLWFAFGTLLRPVAYNFAPDVLSTLLVAGAIVALLYKRSLTAGVLLGLSLWAKWTNAVFFLVVAAALLVQRDWRSLLRFACAAAVPVVGLLGLNWHMFGSPFVTPYDRVMIVERSRWVVEPSHRTFFTIPFWRGLWTQLTDARMGLFVAAPPVLIALPGLVAVFRRARADAILVGAACAAQLAMFAKYEQWNVSSYGPRFLLSVVALSALPAAAALAFVFKRRPDPDHAGDVAA
ncbi:MAG TPA: glycosyltransferase family 87 protein [Polyangia bacterium]|jgi:hypothetical protein|nr:glycosyltransferase family 87 protein [Polyangia bacterium]